jgi:hypothetical protein
MPEGTPTNSANGLNVYANALSCAVAIAALICVPSERLLLRPLGEVLATFECQPAKLTQLFLALGENSVPLILLSIAAIPVATMLLTRSPKWKIFAATAAAALLIGVMAALFLAFHCGLLSLIEITERLSESQPK